MKGFRRSGVAAVAGLAFLAGCSSGSTTPGTDTTAPTTTAAATASTTSAVTPSTEAATTAVPPTAAPTTAEPATTTPPEPLRILVTNDDGVTAAGIDAVVTALTAMNGVEVTVIAPAENQSGTSDTKSDGALATQTAATASGYPAIAVAGFPADTVVFALDQGGLAKPPHVVVSGVNAGQNMGPAVSASGTVGAAREAARHGIPALAVSAQLGADDSDAPDFAIGADAVVAWIEDHRDALIAGQVVAHIYNFNSPNCNELADRGMLDVPVATDLAGRDYLAQPDCATEPADTPTDDVDGLAAGYVTYTELDPAALTGI